ncbi:MAG: HpcH/HpaI aldolase/citrate lyase family protein [Parafilimonas sp.]
MESYFFIPAANEAFVKNISRLSADYFVFDFEDSININNIDKAIDFTRKVNISDNFFARFYWNTHETEFSSVSLKKILQLGFKNFFIPKFRTIEDLDTIYHLLKSNPSFNQFKIVLLIENPQALCSIENILKAYSPFAVAFGSHDYCAEMGMLHADGNIQWARNYLLNFGKAAFVRCIDVASMNIKDKATFEEECTDAFNKGFDGKVLIHPMQLEVFNNTKYYTDEELKIALKVRDILKQKGGIANFSIANIDGLVIEKPHLNRYLKILKMANYDSV